MYKKKILSVVLAIAICFTMVSGCLSALAEDPAIPTASYSIAFGTVRTENNKELVDATVTITDPAEDLFVALVKLNIGDLEVTNVQAAAGSAINVETNGPRNASTGVPTYPFTIDDIDGDTLNVLVDTQENDTTLGNMSFVITFNIKDKTARSITVTDIDAASDNESGATTAGMEGNIKVESSNPAIENGEFPIAPETPTCDHQGKECTYDNITDTTHDVYCECGEFLRTESHDFTNGDCVCGEPAPAPVCTHENKTRTVTTDGNTITITFTCDDCGNTTINTYNYTDISSSTNKFTHTLAIESDITINFKVAKSLISSYTDVFAVFDKQCYNGNVETSSERTVVEAMTDPSSASKYMFPFTGVASKEMNDNISAFVYAGNSNGEYVCIAESYSVVAYVRSAMSAAKPNQYLCTACADLLRYGSASQINFSYNTNNLALDAVSELMTSKGFACSTLRTNFVDASNISSFENSLITDWKRTLDLQYKVIINIRMYGDSNLDISNYELRINYANENLVVDGSDGSITWDGSRWVYAFDKLSAMQFATVFTATLYEKNTGNPVSSTWTNSIESYAAAVCNAGTNQKLMDTVKAMITYGDSIAVYFQHK